MTTFGDLWAAQQNDIRESRQRSTAQSIFSSPPINPFLTTGIEPSEQQQALQARNAPQTAPEPEISTTRLDGSIGRLVSLQDELSATRGMLEFDNERATDIADLLTTLRTEIEDRLVEAESFEAPPEAEPTRRIVSVENSFYVSTDALLRGNQSLSPDDLIGDRNGGEGISLTITAGSNSYTINADATETVESFVGRLGGLVGVSASLDSLGRINISANFGDQLEIRDASAGSMAALGLVADGFETEQGSGDQLGFAAALGTRTKETSVDKVTIFRVDGDARERIEERKDAIRKNDEAIESDLQRFWSNASRDIGVETERSFDRGSSLLGGLTMSLPSVENQGGGRSVTAGNLTVDGLGLSDLGDLLSDGRFEDVYNAIEGALGKISRAQSNLTLALSLVENETGLAESRIGRLADERDAITDEFTAQFVAQQTGLSLQAVQLATASNRSEDLRNL